MSRINTNVQSILAQRVLGQNNQNLAGSLERLDRSSHQPRQGRPGGSDRVAEPACRAVGDRCGDQERRRDQVVNIAEGGLNEVSSLLTELQGLLTSTANDAGLSAEEKEANRRSTRSCRPSTALRRPPRSRARSLLNGNLDYTTTSIDSNVSGFKVNGAARLQRDPRRRCARHAVGSGRRHGDALRRQQHRPDRRGLELHD